MKKLKRSMALFIAILMIFGSSFSSFAGTSQLESKPEEEANQEKTAETLESPAEGLTEPALLSQEDPAEDPDEKPAEDPAEEPAEESDEKPAEESDEKPAEEPDEKPAEEPASKPAAIPVAKPAAIPVAKPAAVPAAKPAEDPVSEPSNDEASQLEEEPVALNLSYAVGSVTIRVFAEAGVLPNDTRLFVEALSYRDSQYYANLVEDREGISLDNFSAFDITLLDSLGNEIQPNGQVRVSFEGLGFIINSNKVAVYHLDSNSVRGAQEISSVENGDEVSFDADHFSIYGVGTKKTATYNFYVGTVLNDTQIVLNGEYLKEPETPAKQEGKKFIGWYIEGEIDPINFNAAITVNETTINKVEARFDDVFYVYFIYDGNIIKTKEVTPPGTTNDSDIPLVILEEDKALDHWSSSVGGTEFDFDTLIEADTALYAVLAARWKVEFDTQGGSPLLPKNIENTEPLGEVDNPERAGYAFSRWNTKADGTGTNYTSTTVINNSVKLYAIWSPKTDTPYTVLYWQENPNDDGYTLKEVVTKTGTTATNAIYDNRTYNGFTLNTTKTNATNVVIKGDGSSVKNVYYDRNTWTLDFQTKIQQGNSGWPFYSPKYVWDSFSTNTIKQGADTSLWWNPAVVQYPTYAWYTTKTGNIAYSLAPDMPNNNLTIYGRESTGYDYTIFYLEDGTGPGYINVHEPFNFNNGGDLTLTIEDYVEFPGFTVKSEVGDGSENYSYNNVTNKREWKIYYTRNRYNITFKPNDGTGNQVVSEIPYEQDISNKALAGYTVDITEKNGGYVFKGWYDNDQAQGEAYNFAGKKMPAGDLILYAKWVPPTYTLEYYESKNWDGIRKKIEHIVAESAISESQLTKTIPSELTEEDFRGWYWYLYDTFLLYDFNTPVINNDYVLYPVWNDLIYKVTYQAGGGSGAVPLDNNNYKRNTAASVLPPTGLTAPTNKVFIGWNTAANGSGTNYYPNQKLDMFGDTTLTAQWGAIVPDATITYKANGGSGADQSETVKNNDKHQVKQNMFTRAGYEFTKWNTKADGSGSSFQPTAEIIVSNSNLAANELYAQWEKTKISITGTKVWVGGFSQKPTIELQLYRKIEGGAEVEVETPVELTNGTETYTWTALDQTDNNGQIYQYTVKEVDLPDYHTKVEEGLTVTNTHSEGSLTVSKVVTGNFGDRSKEFEVEVIFTLPSGKTLEGNITSSPSVTWNGLTASFNLKHGDSVTFNNIPYGVTYAVVEDDYTSEGYAEAGYIFSDTAKKIDSAEDSVEITNNKSAHLDTGISLNSIPYIIILLVLLIGGLGWFIRKRRHIDFE